MKTKLNDLNGSVNRALRKKKASESEVERLVFQDITESVLAILEEHQKTSAKLAIAIEKLTARMADTKVDVNFDTDRMGAELGKHLKGLVTPEEVESAEDETLVVKGPVSYEATITRSGKDGVMTSVRLDPVGLNSRVI